MPDRTDVGTSQSAEPSSNDHSTHSTPVRRPRSTTASWAPFAMPGVAWLATFFVLPVYAVMAVAFGSIDPILRTAAPQWNPLSWDFTAMGQVLDRVIGGDLGTVFKRTFLFVAGALLGCLIIGYPVAYYVARKAGRYRGRLLALLVLPFWISYLMRMLAWTNLLQPDGFVNRALGWTHLMSTPRNWLDGSWPTVVIGLTYGYIPFFILPLCATLERLDGRLLEAGRDLGASATQTFLRVTLPLSIPGLMSASIITMLPMFGDYYTNTYLSGSPKTDMIGNQVEYFLRKSSQPQKGASLVLVLMVMLLAMMVYYLVTTMRQQRLADR